MRHANRAFAALILFTATIILSGCYTQLASDKGDYYGYTGHVRHRAEPVRTDTITVHSAVRNPESVEIAKQFDTTVKGDTVYIDERPSAPPAELSSETIVNNYYDYDAYRAYNPYIDNGYYWFPEPHAALSITIGYPYGYWPHHSWYSPWYAYSPSWYYPYDWGYNNWGYPGFYPPVYDCYAPYYGGYPYYSNYYGYGGGYYGGNDHHDRLSRGRTVGRIASGERRPGESTNPLTGLPGNSITPKLPNSGVESFTDRGSTFAPLPGRSTSVTGVTNSEPASSIAGADRNAPVHVVAPASITTGSGTSGRASSSVVADGRATAPSAVSQSTGLREPSQNRTGTDASAASHIVQTDFANAPSAQSNHRVIVIRRAPSASAGLSGGSNSGYGNYRTSSSNGYAPLPDRGSSRTTSVDRSGSGNSGSGSGAYSTGRTGGSSTRETSTTRSTDAERPVARPSNESHSTTESRSSTEGRSESHSSGEGRSGGETRSTGGGGRR